MDKEALRQIMALLSDKERHKKIMEKLGPYAITLYEGFANEGLVSMYELFNSEHKDKLISLILKELDMEDYKKKLEKARKLYYAESVTKEQKHVLESRFPELKESEDENTDEKIRKALIKLVINHARMGLFIQSQVKEYLISQHESKICKESDDSLTSEDERIRQEIIAFLKYYHTGQGNMVMYDNNWIAWLKSLKGRVQPQPKQGWSEEDEKMCQETIDWFEKKIFPYAIEIENPARESIKWLKSLKGRMQPQPRQGWSEEDEKMLDIILNDINYAQKNFSDSKLIPYDRKVDWLNSPRHQSAWKPSESDILLLERIANGKSNPQDFQASLESLIGQLKKLKE